MSAAPTNKAPIVAEEFCAWILDGEGGARQVHPEAGLKACEAGQTVWFNVDFSDHAGRAWLETKSGIDDAITVAMLAEDSRPRVLETPDGILTILRGVNLNPGSPIEDMISVRIWLEGTRVFTASRRRLKSVERMREALQEGRGPRSAPLFQLQLISQLLDRIGEAIDALDDALEEAENLVSRQNMTARSTPFGEQRRKTARIRRYLAPQREALDRLSRITDTFFGERQLAELREQLNRLTLLIEDLDLIRERAMVAQEEFLGIVAHEQNSRMFLLSIVAAIFLPLSFLTGLMGMNVAGLPGTENEWSFAIIAMIMGLIAAGILLIFRFSKWF
ncbi:MAG: zinc transporter ZntB [Xanthomonadales bacterium]|nr:zinc transporter ZntB [Xanthomonadales bacterium]